MQQNIPHGEIVSAAKEFMTAVVVEGKKIWMGCAISDEEFNSCMIVENIIADIRERYPKWAAHEFPGKIIAPVFLKMASCEGSGVLVTPRTGMVKGFHYYERDPKLVATAPVTSRAAVLETV